MLQPYKILRSVDCADSFDETEAFALDVLLGLSGAKKKLSSKYLYDQRGSELFHQITELPEYYLTNCELEIIETQGGRISEYVDPNQPYNVVELGAGAGKKTTALLSRIIAHREDLQYVPIDVSEGAMRALVASLSAQFPALKINGLVTDYFNGLKWLNGKSRRNNLVLFMGSSIGNYTHQENGVLLRSLWNCLNHGDLMLIGFDLKKDIDQMLRAYNDSQGVTAEFNKNLLHRINRELGANFEVDYWRHYGTYDVFSGGMESYLVSMRRQTVYIERFGKYFEFEMWEPIHTECSYKYLVSEIEDMARESGFEPSENLFDSRRYFVDSIWRVKKPGSMRVSPREGGE